MVGNESKWLVCFSLSPNEVPTSVLVPRSDVTTSLSKSIRDSQRSEGEARTKVVAH